MKLDTLRFGEIEINDRSIIRFPGGIPGLNDLEKYAIVQSEQTEPIQWLQSTEDPDIALPIINPFFLVPDYQIEVDDSELEYIETYDEENLLVVNIMVVPEDLSKMTVNLLAPILINLEAMLGTQVMMDHTEYDVAYPAFEPLVRYYEREGEVIPGAGAVEKAE